MPRASTYAKHASKYKRQVKPKRFIKQFEKYVFIIPKDFLTIGQGYDVVNYAEDLKKLTKLKLWQRLFELSPKTLTPFMASE
jgi:hypothetical protein